MGCNYLSPYEFTYQLYWMDHLDNTPTNPQLPGLIWIYCRGSVISEKVKKYHAWDFYRKHIFIFFVTVNQNSSIWQYCITLGIFTVRFSLVCLYIKPLRGWKFQHFDSKFWWHFIVKIRTCHFIRMIQCLFRTRYGWLVTDPGDIHAADISYERRTNSSV